MKLVLQRVTKAAVEVEGCIVGKINRGWLVLIGITHSDTPKESTYLAGRVLGLRSFPDAEGKMNQSIQDIAGELLVVSQFTLYGNTKKGRRPSFVEAAAPSHAESLYDHFVQTVKKTAKGKVETGVFGATMSVSLINDGPVTLLLET